VTRLDKLEQLLKAATPGPWASSKDHNANGCVTAEDGQKIVCDISGGYIPHPRGKPDRDLIAEAHNIMPDLIRLGRAAELSMKVSKDYVVDRETNTLHLLDSDGVIRAATGLTDALDALLMPIPAEPGSLPDAPAKEVQL
jgi:hypothetical protein